MIPPYPSYKSFIFFFTSLFVLAACDQFQHQDVEQLLAGEESKSWRTDQDHSPSGDHRTLTQLEGQQIIEFHTDGSFELRGPQVSKSGSWTYSPTERMLEINFEEQPAIIESYYVSRLEEDELYLRTPDGATMQYKSVEKNNTTP